MRAALFLMGAALATAGITTADVGEGDLMQVRLSVYFDLSGESGPVLMTIGKQPKTFTSKVDEDEKLSLTMTRLHGCRVRIEAPQSHSITAVRPSPWPAFFEPGTTFAIGVHFPRHRQEVRGSVSGAGACSRTAPNTVLEPTWKPTRLSVRQPT